MSRSFLLLCSSFCTALLAPWTAASAQQVGPFRSERFDENWSGVGDDAPFGAALKNIDLGHDVRLSLGGDARWRFSWLDAPRLGLGGVQEDAWVLQRLLAHADLRFGDNARVFVQLGAHDGVSREIASSTDDDTLDLQQAFIDLHKKVGSADVTLRLGRQELVLGPRFASARDSGNVRQRHDMARVIITGGDWRLDAFGGRPTEVNRGAFDDEPDPNQRFYGARMQHKTRDTTLEISAYRLDRDAVTLAGVTAPDDRTSYGAHAFGRRGSIDFDAEAVFQSGAFGGDDIRAFGAALDLGRTFTETPMTPRINLRLTYGSGDSAAGDGKQETFAPVFPNSSWFGQNGLASFSNTIETAGMIAITPRENVTLTAKLAAVWRADTNDFLYAGNTALANTSGGDEAFTGVSPSLSLVWRPNANITINPYVSYVVLTDEVRDRGAHNVTYAHLTIGLRF